MPLTKNSAAILLSLCILLFIPVASYAQDSRAMLQEVARHLSAGSELYFKLLATSEGEELYRTEGTLLLRKDKFRLRYESLDVCFDGESLSYYDFKDNRLTLLAYDEKELLQLNPVLFINYSLQQYDICSIDRGQNNQLSLLLQPRQSDAVYQRIVVSLDEKGAVPRTVETTTHDGVLTRVDISRFTKRSDLTDKHFVQPRELYKTSEIVDLR